MLRITRTAQIVGLLLTLTSLVLSSMPRPVSANDGSAKHVTATASKQSLGPISPASIKQKYGRVDLSFEANHGQSDARVKFISRGPGYTLFLTPTEATFKLRAAKEQSAVLRMKFEGANKHAQIDGRNQLSGVTHYFKGRDRSKWVKNIPSYEQANYKNLYPGIDLVFYGREEDLEYDFVVAPQGTPAQIKLKFDGAQKPSVDRDGNLILKTKLGEVVHEAPVAYQDTPQGRRTIESRYSIASDGHVGFKLGEYDRSLSLVIDPVMKLTFSTYFGGKALDFSEDVAVDAENQAIVVGQTKSPDFPANNADPEEGNDAFVTKFKADGTGTIYSVYLGGRKLDRAKGVAVDRDGNAYVTGQTTSPDFPTTPGVVDENGSILPAPGASTGLEDVFVTKLDREGTISYSTYLAGPDEDIGNGIAVDNAGRAYVTGQTSSARFPVKNEFQNDVIFGASVDAFITVLNSEATGFIYSSYFGGFSFDAAEAVAIDADGNAYITGGTDSNGTFPFKSPSASGPFQDFNAGNFDAWVAKFNPFEKGDDSLIYSTCVGGRGPDETNDIALDALNRAYVVGVTKSEDFPVRAVENAQVLDPQIADRDAFVFRISADASTLQFSTFFGGEAEELGEGIQVDPAGNIHITGNTNSSRTFPIVQAFQSNFGGGERDGDAFIAKLAPDARQILYSSYLGGRDEEQGMAVAIDGGGNAYVTGRTASEDYPVEAPLQQNNAGDEDFFLTKIGEMNADTVGVFKQTGTQFELRNSNTEGPADIIPVFGAAGDLPIKGDWEGDGIDTIGVFRPSTAEFFLATSNENPQVGVIIFSFGQVGDQPVAGDWDGDGDDEIGVFNGTNFTLRSNTDQAGFATTDVPFGAIGDLPVAGDFDGDGDDTVGVWRPSTSEFFLTQSIQDPQNGVVTTVFGLIGDLPVIGDWNGDGIDTIGTFGPPRKREPFAAGFFLSNSNTVAQSDLVIGFGQLGDRPVGGDWDGKP